MWTTTCNIVIVAAGLILLLASSAVSAVVLSNGNEHCTVQATSYVLRINTGAGQGEGRSSLFELFSPDGKKPLAAFTSLHISEENCSYRSDLALPHPHLHTLRCGSYLVEMYLENVILKVPNQAGSNWPGLAEVGLFCH